MSGMLNASIATKCIDQMPPPNATAAAISQILRARPLDARILFAKLSAVNEANTATATDRRTRWWSCVPFMLVTDTLVTLLRTIRPLRHHLCQLTVQAR